MKRYWVFLSVLVLLPACQQQPKQFQYHETIAGIEHTLWISGGNEKTAQINVLSNFQAIHDVRIK